MKPTAWFDPSNGVVSTDQDCPLFTPLGQVWPLYPKGEWVDLTAEEVLQCWEKAHEPGNKEHINAIRMADEVEAKLKEKNCG